MGNQMFMYAAGLAVASKLNTELLLDISSFSSYRRNDRPYQLSCFPEITERTASFSDIWKLSPGLALVSVLHRKKLDIHHLTRRLMCEILYMTRIAPIGFKTVVRLPKDAKFPYPYRFSRIYIERNDRNRLYEIPDDTCIVGFWESEKFFDGYADKVRRKFRFSPECFGPVLSERVRNCNSVAVHVRRGDKVPNGEHGASNLTYLRHSIEKILSLTEKPEFFVFSDDISWCKENLRKAYEADYHFIEGQTVAQDMALMSICKHVIMGPSTFSWWGAWLNENPSKIILAPQKYRENTDWHPRCAILVD